jgi:lipopolysaccharide export system protein LptA
MPSLQLCVRLPLLSLITLTTFAGIFSANAQTTENPMRITSDAQTYNKDTGVATAIGNAKLTYSAAQLEGTAQKIEYHSKNKELVFIGGANVVQGQETFKGDKIVCQTEKLKCSVIN